MLLNFTHQELERVECDIKAHIKNKYRAKQDQIKQERKNEEDTSIRARKSSSIKYYIY